jgi:rhodanese-related sulfurtransferase
MPKRNETVMKPKEISPAEAAELVQRGALLVDVREAAERRLGVIPGAAHAPLSALNRADLGGKPGQPVIFHCRSGGRTTLNAAALKAKAGACETYLLRGGIDAWRAAGLPVERG